MREPYIASSQISFANKGLGLGINTLCKIKVNTREVSPLLLNLSYIYISPVSPECFYRSPLKGAWKVRCSIHPGEAFC
jgi:hypothetical protein